MLNCYLLRLSILVHVQTSRLDTGDILISAKSSLRLLHHCDEKNAHLCILEKSIKKLCLECENKNVSLERNGNLPEMLILNSVNRRVNLCLQQKEQSSPAIHSPFPQSSV